MWAFAQSDACSSRECCERPRPIPKSDLDTFFSPEAAQTVGTLRRAIGRLNRVVLAGLSVIHGEAGMTRGPKFHCPPSKKR